MSQVTKGPGGLPQRRLLLERPLDKITVTDIAEDCGINRMTFYHFRDIYDLVEWACQEDARRILDGKAPIPPGREGFRRILDGLIDNRPFILNVYRSVRREQVETFLSGHPRPAHGRGGGAGPPGRGAGGGQGLSGRLLKYAFVGAGSGLDPHRHEGRAGGAGPPGRAGGFGRLCPRRWSACGRIPPIRRAV